METYVADAELDFLNRVRLSERPKERLAAYAPHYLYFSREQVRAFSRIFAVIPSTDVKALSRLSDVLHDELGRGKSSNVHSEMYRRFALSVGCKREELEEATRNPLAGVANYLAALDEYFGGSIQEAVSAYVFLERSAVASYKPFLDMLMSLDDDSIDPQFFEEHSVVEIEHEKFATELYGQYCGDVKESDNEVIAELGRRWRALWMDLSNAAGFQ